MRNGKRHIKAVGIKDFYRQNLFKLQKEYNFLIIKGVKKIPNRRAHDHIGQFQAAGIRKRDISVLIKNMENLVQKGVALKDLEVIAKNIIRDTRFREAFMKNADVAIGRIGIMPVPSP